MSIVQKARLKFLQMEKEKSDIEYARKHRGKKRKNPTIWASDIGSQCKRKVMLRVTGVDGEDNFSDKALDYMRAGVITEDDTGLALATVYGDRLYNDPNDETDGQLKLKYEMLSGKPDFTIDHETDNVILIEHKVTSERHWNTDAKSDLPKHNHLGQAMCYMYMYERKYGITPIVKLYYKSFGNFAEYTLNHNEDGTLTMLSDINGVHDVEQYSHNFYDEIREYISLYKSGTIPDKLDKKYKGCEFAGRPSCKFYKYCWGD